MAVYKSIIITGKEIQPIPPIDHVLVDLKLNVLANKLNFYSVVIYNIAKKVKELVNDKTVTLTLWFDEKIQIDVPNVKLLYDNENIIISADEIIHKTISSFTKNS
ncbi:hypothetical protein [Clostridium pasteurianum]|uniref:Uncharacterized protein n=1 Tax=Clostridium pasteurianum BC1 TaxID=86416 RepID=R4KAW8_CLOPA|nr:hypothetical protein [Clostridium pasteurianum]AGK96780.1 hypothetical protein Clopa_1880 [Clostridium pasteurianum BC1]